MKSYRPAFGTIFIGLFAVLLGTGALLSAFGFNVFFSPHLDFTWLVAGVLVLCAVLLLTAALWPQHAKDASAGAGLGFGPGSGPGVGPSSGPGAGPGAVPSSRPGFAAAEPRVSDLFDSQPATETFATSQTQQFSTQPTQSFATHPTQEFSSTAFGRPVADQVRHFVPITDNEVTDNEVLDTQVTDNDTHYPQ